MADPFIRYATELDSPGRCWKAITPSDTVDIPDRPRALYVGTGGNISAIDQNGNTVTFSNVLGGAFLPIGPVRIRATGTTASNIVGIW